MYLFNSKKWKINYTLSRKLETKEFVPMYYNVLKFYLCHPHAEASSYLALIFLHLLIYKDLLLASVDDTHKKG